MMGESQKTKLKVAAIGAGYFSHFHYDAWSRMEQVELVACCDRDIRKAQGIADRYKIPRVFADHRKMLDACPVDFVDVITRPDTHLGLVREIADRSLNCICQKPLAPTEAEALQLVQTAESANVRLMVHENFRFQPWYREIKSLYDSGGIGTQLHTVTFRNRAGDGHGPKAYLARQPYFQTMPRFLIFEAGIHTIDTFRFLAGEVAQVWCNIRRLNPVIVGEDAALSVFEFENGGMGLYDANRFNESTAEDPRYTFGELLFECDGGAIRLYQDGRLTIQPLGERESEHSYAHSHHGFGGDCVYATQLHFVEKLIDGGEFETSGRDYLRSIAVQEAMYRSARSGTWEAPAAVSERLVD